MKHCGNLYKITAYVPASFTPSKIYTERIKMHFISMEALNFYWSSKRMLIFSSHLELLMVMVLPTLEDGSPSIAASQMTLLLRLKWKAKLVAL